MSEEIPSIYLKETKIAPDGTEIKVKELAVHGKYLNEVKKVFDEEWKNCSRRDKKV